MAGSILSTRALRRRQLSGTSATARLGKKSLSPSQETLEENPLHIVNMSAVAKQYGAAHRAFIVVPLVCGFFIDLVNALVINFFLAL